MLLSFWKKTFVFIIFFVAFVVLQCYTESVGHFELDCFKNKFSVDLYVVLAGITAVWFAVFVVRSLGLWIVSLCVRERIDAELESINSIASLILSNDSDFLKSVDNVNIINKHKILKTAVILKREVAYSKTLDLTGVDIVDVYILRKQLADLIEKGDNHNAINIADKIIRKYKKLLNIAKEEILKVAVIARKNNIEFVFDPRKYKYDLPQSFVEKYLVELDMADYEAAENDELKLKILERSYKNYQNNSKVSMELLNFIFEKYPEKYSEKKIIEILTHSFESKPNRKLAYNLLKIKRNDIFEVAQEITAKIPDNNVEKLWMLLIIATRLEFITKAKELIKKIVEVDTSDEILEFYVKYQNKLSANDCEVINILKGKVK